MVILETSPILQSDFNVLIAILTMHKKMIWIPISNESMKKMVILETKPILQPDSNVLIVIVTMLGNLLCKSMKKTVNLLVNSNVPIVNVNSQRNQI